MVVSWPPRLDRSGDGWAYQDRHLRDLPQIHLVGIGVHRRIPPWGCPLNLMFDVPTAGADGTPALRSGYSAGQARVLQIQVKHLPRLKSAPQQSSVSPRRLPMSWRLLSRRDRCGLGGLSSTPARRHLYPRLVTRPFFLGDVPLPDKVRPSGGGEGRAGVIQVDLLLLEAGPGAGLAHGDDSSRERETELRNRGVHRLCLPVFS